MTQLLANKTALITGASRGIGRAIAETFASNGCNLILFARSEDKLLALKQKLEQQYNSIHVFIFAVDVTNTETIKSAVAQISQQKIPIDIIVNNAGVMIDAPLMMMKSEAIKQNIDVNLYGTINITQAFVKLLIKNRNGSIINLSSIVGTNGSAGQSVYSASKSAIIGFTKSLSKELASLNIRVNAIAPGFIDTDLVANLPEQAKEKTLANIGMKRLGQPTDVSHVALFLASDLSAYVTGQVIGVDGGMII
jgi:3-oxoacyl-[acyl-carrier protein] reductase